MMLRNWLRTCAARVREFFCGKSVAEQSAPRPPRLFVPPPSDRCDRDEPAILRFPESAIHGRLRLYVPPSDAGEAEVACCGDGEGI